MKDTAKVLTVLLGLMLVLGATGCKRKCVEPIEPIAPPPPSTETISEQPIEPEQQAMALSLQTVHFDFDRSDIREGDAMKLQENAAQIKQASDAGSKPMVSVEGHCDPMGTSEYNMALGLRRAESAKAYLVKLGVDPMQLSTISYGEERLVTQNEAEYELNRRAEFKVAQ
jgi:peptidoglycan-associated lipoprotein